MIPSPDIIKRYYTCMRSLIFSIAGLFIAISLVAQEPVKVERSRNKVIIQDKVYYIHIVKPGQTLYSISRAYNISQKEISIENPGVLSGLQIGQALKIPVEGEPAQIDTTELPDRQEGRFIRHVIKEGETIYAISREYNVPVDSILKYNTGMEITDLGIGDELLIPVQTEKQQVEQPSFNEQGYIYHKVKRRETLYSIARYYNVTVEDIRAANSELGWGGPRTGQVIRIPEPQLIDNSLIAQDTIIPDTLLPVFPDTLMEEYKYRELYFEDYRPRRTYKVAFLIPFNIIEGEPLDSLLKDVKSENQRNRIIEKYRLEQSIPQSVNFTEFFEGALLGIDSVRKTGMKLDISFFDTKRSVSRINTILNYEEMEDMDLIIGPFYSFNLKPASDFCKTYNIPLVTPFHSEYDFIQDNPYLFQISSSYQTEYQAAAKYIAGCTDKNIVLVHSGDSLDLMKINYFKDVLFKEFSEYFDAEDIPMKEVVYENGASGELIHSLSTDKENLVVVPLDDEALASQISSFLYFQRKDYGIQLFGTSAWPEFTSIDVRYFHALNLTFPHPGLMDYEDPQIIKYLADCRSNYYAEPVEKTRNGTYYSFLGYDITLFFLQAIRDFGPRFILKLEDYHPDLLLGSYKFFRVTDYGGYENRELKYYQYTPDMNIITVEAPEKPVQHYQYEPFEESNPPSYLIFDRDKQKLEK